MSLAPAADRAYFAAFLDLRGKPAVVVVSYEEFQDLTRPSTSLREFFRQSPLYGTDLDLERSKDISREVPL